MLRYRHDTTLNLPTPIPSRLADALRSDGYALLRPADVARAGRLQRSTSWTRWRRAGTSSNSTTT